MTSKILFASLVILAASQTINYTTAIQSVPFGQSTITSYCTNTFMAPSTLPYHIIQVLNTNQLWFLYNLSSSDPYIQTTQMINSRPEIIRVDSGQNYFVDLDFTIAPYSNPYSNIAPTRFFGACVDFNYNRYINGSSTATSLTVEFSLAMRNGTPMCGTATSVSAVIDGANYGVQTMTGAICANLI